MKNKLVILFIVLLLILGFNILSMFDIVPKKIANIIYIIFSIFPLYAPFLWCGGEKEKPLMKVQHEKKKQGIKYRTKQVTIVPTNL